MARFPLSRPGKKTSLVLLTLVALALAPGTWLRSEVRFNGSATIRALPVAVDLPGSVGEFRRESLWQLESDNPLFAGYSALMPIEQRRLVAFSDRGSRFTFREPAGRGGDIHGDFAEQSDRGRFSGFLPDIESATRDPSTGRYWLGFESRHSVLRYSAASELEGAVAPPEWQGWPGNAGAEAMTRLADGSFLVLPEASRTGLLYAADPISGGEPLRFPFELAGRFDATDLAALPDGRILVLERALAPSFPPFSARLAIGDPASIAAGETWRPTPLLDLDALLPRENYEGMAVRARGDGSVTIWLISDDNQSALQRTLLAELRWTPEG